MYKAMEKEFIHLFELNESGNPIRGIEVGEGFSIHVRKLLEYLDWHCNNNMAVDNPDYDPSKRVGEGNYPCILTNKPNVIKIFCIKEKFGRVRVSWDCDNPRIHNAIIETVSEFIGKCSITCSRCGALEYDIIKRNEDGYFTSICVDCVEDSKQ